MNIDEWLNMMEEMLEEATGLPFAGGKRVVDADRMQDIIDEVRLNLPTEVRQAKAIVNDRAEIVADAKREAEAIVKKAEDRARVLVSEQEVVKAAQQRAAEIVSSAQTHAHHRHRLLREYVAHHRGAAGPQRRRGQDRARQPAPERQERLIFRRFPFNIAHRAVNFGSRPFFCAIRQKHVKKSVSHAPDFYIPYLEFHRSIPYN